MPPAINVWIGLAMPAEIANFVAIMERTFGASVGRLARKPANSKRGLTAIYVPSLRSQFCDDLRELTVWEPSHLRDDGVTV